MSAALRLCFALALLGPAGSAAMADDFTPPEGCTVYLTVQNRACEVEHHYTCAAHPGHRWALTVTEDGPTFLSHIDADAQWIESIGSPDNQHDVTLPDPADPQSITALLETGYDAWDLTERRGTGQTVRYQGFDQLTGGQVEIDGEPLLETRYRFRAIDAESGHLLETAWGQEYVSQRHRRFFSGTRTYLTPDGEITLENPPMAFVYPGEGGFLSNTPLYGCTEMMSALPQHRSAS